MSRATLTTALLLVLLLATNACWAYQALDTGVTMTHREETFRLTHKGLVQALAILPLVADSSSSPEQIIAAAGQASSDSEPFHKEGFTWVGSLGLRFNDEGRLVEAVPSWSPF